MADFWIGVGTVLALFGPLLLLPVVWVVYRAARSIFRRSAPDSALSTQRGTALAVAVLLVASVLLASYLPGRMAFDRLCRQNAVPVLIDSVSVPGFYRTHLFPYEAHQYFSQGFAFVEAPDPYTDSTVIRYSLDDDGSLIQETVSELESEFAVDEQFGTVKWGIMSRAKHVYHLESGRTLGIAHNMHYEGGPLSIFLGVYGMSSCPDPITVAGSNWFGTFYNLEKRLLLAPS
jgi:hypothetical protein